MIERKVCEQSELKIDDGSGPGTITFYVSTFGNWDRVRPVPEQPSQTAFDRHLEAFARDGWITEAHQWEKRPVATIKDVFRDAKGALVVGEYHTTADAQESRRTSLERLQRNKSVKTSMGYVVHDSRLVEMDDPTLKAEGITHGRMLTDVELLEASIVNRPANPQADVLGVKNLLETGGSFTDRALMAEAVIKSLAQSAEVQEIARLKENRELSAANRARLRAVLEAMDAFDPHRETIRELLARTEPKALADPAAVRQALAQLYVLQAHTANLSLST